MITYREYCKTIKEDWGKTSPIPKEVYDYPDPFKDMDINWVDLGLPSGTLWADRNIYNPDNQWGFWSYAEIMDSVYAPFVPTREQMVELGKLYKAEKWAWDGNERRYRVRGWNGQVIYLPAEGCLHDGKLPFVEGCLGDYLTSTPAKEAGFCCSLHFRGGGDWVYPDIIFHNDSSCSVRLVKNKN